MTQESPWAEGKKFFAEMVNRVTLSVILPDLLPSVKSLIITF